MFICHKHIFFWLSVQTVYSILSQLNWVVRVIYKSWTIFSFCILKVLLHCLLVFLVSEEKPIVIQISVVPFATCVSLRNTYSLPFIFSAFTVICLCIVLFEFILFGVLCASCNSKFIYFTKFGKFGVIRFSSSYFYATLPFSFPYWTLMTYMSDILILFIGSWGCLHSVKSFASPSKWIISIDLSSSSQIPLSFIYYH